MKKNFIVIIFYFIFFINCFSQSGWQWFNPLPSNKLLQNTQFVNQNTGFSPINYKLFKTTNGGTTWYIPGDTISGFNYKFINESTGLAFSSSIIYKTTNSGINWSFYGSYANIPDISYNGLDFYDINTAFITFVYYSPFGPYGHIGCTTNGGANWFNPNYPEPLGFLGIKILSPYNAYALGNDSGSIFLYKSFAPLTSWFRIPTGLNNAITPKLFVKDSLNLFISAGTLIFSTNGGYNWQNTGLSGIKDIKFINSNTGIATGSSQQIFRSINGGFNWLQIQSPVNYNFYSVSFGVPSVGYITGELGSVLKTIDYGQTWTANCSYFTLKNLNDLSFTGKDTLIIVADSGTIYRTTNQGLNWNYIVTANNKKIRKIFFLDKVTGFAIADSGNFLKTTNSGVSWQLINMGFYDYFDNDIFFINQNTGFVCSGGSVGNIYRTINGGLNWVMLPRPSTGNYFFIRFFNTNTGFTSSWEKIYRTTNLGDNWTLMNTDINSQNHRDICFINNMTGFTAGGDGYIHKTTDGGFNWLPTSKLVYSDVFRVTFINEQTGYSTAGYGFTGLFSAIFNTTNGGTTWQKMFIPMGTNAEKLGGINFYDVNTGFVAGDGGIIFKTTTGGFLGLNQKKDIIPSKFELFQNYPNPFNPSTVIGYSLLTNGFVTMKVYDILGREIETLVNEFQKAGTYETKFPINNNQLPSGFYFYRLITEEFSDTKKMILLK